MHAARERPKIGFSEGVVPISDKSWPKWFAKFPGSYVLAKRVYHDADFLSFYFFGSARPILIGLSNNRSTANLNLHLTALLQVSNKLKANKSKSELT